MGVQRTYHGEPDKNQQLRSPRDLPGRLVCSFLRQSRFVPQHIKVWLAAGSDSCWKQWSRRPRESDNFTWHRSRRGVSSDLCGKRAWIYLKETKLTQLQKWERVANKHGLLSDLTLGKKYQFHSIYMKILKQKMYNMFEELYQGYQGGMTIKQHWQHSLVWCGHFYWVKKTTTRLTTFSNGLKWCCRINENFKESHMFNTSTHVCGPIMLW